MKIKLIHWFYQNRIKSLHFMMRTFILLLCTSVFSFNSGNIFSQSKVTIHTNQTITVDEVFELIMNQTDYNFIYQTHLFDNYPKVSLNKGKIKIETLLHKTLEKGDFSYSLSSDKTIIIKQISEKPIESVSSLKSFQQKITGTVLDETGEPLPGVNVIFKGHQTGASTDINGKYELNISNQNNNIVLVFTFLGYKDLEVAIGNKTVIDVNMIPSLAGLDEVVVIGYGTSKIKDATGAISRISAKDIENAPMGASVESLLQGRSAGVNVQIQSASPTSPISVVIRGASSLSGNNQPLWVIDGVPQYSSTTSGNIANTLYNLNLNDVKSIDILKDASATAVYGSRAANGVVIVTTKKGKAGMKPIFEVSSRVGVQVMDFNGYQYFEADEYKTFADAAAREMIMVRPGFDYFSRSYLDQQAFFDLNTSEYDKTDLQVLPTAYFDGNTNWQEEMTQNPLVTQQDFSVRGGSEATTYFVSFNYRNMEGIVKTGKSELYGGRVNLDTKINNNIKFGLNLSGSTRNSDDKDYMLDILKKVRPDIPAFNEDGSIFTKDRYTENPYTTLKNTRSGKGITFNGTAFLDIGIVEGLDFRTAFTNNYTDSQNLNYSRSGSRFNTTGSRSWYNSKASLNVWENTLTYAKMINDKHDIRALAGYSLENNIVRGYSMSATNFPDDDILNNFSSAASVGNITETQTENALISQFARVHYKFDDRYIISGTIRRDGSSRFGADKRWGIFPSGAAAWLVSSEKFMQNENITKYVNYLKLRASLGLSGSQNLGNFDWITQVGSTRYNENPAIQPSSIGNPNLQWEQTQMFDLGLDFGLLDDRIYGSIGIYQKRSDELIYSSPLAPSSAFSSITSNVASIKNDGFEFDIKYDILRTSNQRLTFDFNFSKNVTKVTKINGDTEELLFPSSRTTYIRMLEGEETGQWFGFQTAGRFYVNAEDAIANQGRTETGQTTYLNSAQETAGDLIFIDQDGDGKITNEDRVNLGSSVPKGFGGFGLTYRYKGLLVNAAFTYAFGHTRLWKLPLSDIGYVGNYNQSNLIAGQSTILNSPYEASYPRMAQYGIGSNNRFSDFYLHDASYLRLNALNITYKLPSKLFKNMVVNGIDLTFQATNLFTLTKYPGFDPQGNWTSSSIGSGMAVDESTYPSAQIYNLGIKINLQ
ncbi:SusC/RagA family TonB-linked outer membrane protein [Algibacter pacificus]|uniref:SusC/RagA family TonB-linked outer membrane protein n=1 Tax=Algibacter pacificus TaxID=2599389 RepID=UPI0011CA9544|nr:SusC/RagA family TonB-linked outer membrane protein [Algibacter pacificus]